MVKLKAIRMSPELLFAQPNLWAGARLRAALGSFAGMVVVDPELAPGIMKIVDHEGGERTITVSPELL